MELCRPKQQALGEWPPESPDRERVSQAPLVRRRPPIALAFSGLIVVLYPVARITGISGRIFNKSLAKSASLKPGIV